MKKILLIFTLLCSLMFSSTSFAEWTEVGESVTGHTHYVDFERIRKHDGYVYYWRLANYLEPNEDGTLSAKVYKKGDCKLFRLKSLSFFFHQEPMGRGSAKMYDPTKHPDHAGWYYLSPNSIGEAVLKSVCEHAK